MTRTGRALIAVATMTTVLLPAAPAVADDNSAFGRHVATCAQTMGFSGTHNPGMHRGAAGWNGMGCA